VQVSAQIQHATQNGGTTAHSGATHGFPAARREILVAIRELDKRGRPGRAFITQTDYLPHTERTTMNKSFTAG
jgi:hypothetical protein